MCSSLSPTTASASFALYIWYFHCLYFFASLSQIVKPELPRKRPTSAQRELAFAILAATSYFRHRLTVNSFGLWALALAAMLLPP
jgi:hypothetical protein